MNAIRDFICSIAGVAAFVCIVPSLMADDLKSLEAYDVVWNRQSRNSSESMPCGGGDTGMNVWVENGDHRKDTPLFPAGLIGPVSLVTLSSR